MRNRERIKKLEDELSSLREQYYDLEYKVSHPNKYEKGYKFGNYVVSSVRMYKSTYRYIPGYTFRCWHYSVDDNTQNFSRFFDEESLCKFVESVLSQSAVVDSGCDNKNTTIDPPKL